EEHGVGKQSLIEPNDLVPVTRVDGGAQRALGRLQVVESIMLRETDVLLEAAEVIAMLGTLLRHGPPEQQHPRGECEQGGEAHDDRPDSPEGKVESDDGENE